MPVQRAVEESHIGSLPCSFVPNLPRMADWNKRPSKGELLAISLATTDPHLAPPYITLSVDTKSVFRGLWLIV